MRRFLWCALLVVSAHGAAAQSFLPQVESSGDLRPLATMDVARGYEAVGRLDHDRGYCSATLIANNLLLTAAHCLYDDAGQRIADDRFTFRAGLRNGRAETERGVKLSFIPPEYRHNPDPSFETVAADIALLELDRPINLAQVQPIQAGGSIRSRDMLTIVSYGRDRDTFASIEEDCRVLQQHETVITMSCSVVQGSSGAPVLRRTPSGLEVVAVVSAGGVYRDEYASFAVDADDHLRALMAARALAGGDGASVRRLSADEDRRDEIGARFLRP